MRFAISIPQFVSDGEFDPAGFRAYMAEQMERLVAEVMPKVA